MKTITTLAAITALSVTSPAFAGGFAEPLMEPEVITEGATASAGGYLVPLLIIALLVAVASSSDSSTPPVKVLPPS